MSTPTTPTRPVGPRGEHTRHLQHHARRVEAPEHDRPEAVEQREPSALARHRDPSRTARDANGKPRPGRGVEWVRPSDLMTRAGARVAGRGIDFEAELARRTRRLPVTTLRATGRGIGQVHRRVAAHQAVRREQRTVRERERAQGLPPVSAFGAGKRAPYSWVSRSGIGLG